VELRHVRYFIAVAECLNFSKAAQRLHIAQPPLSRQIRQLEEDLGVALLLRNKRSVELTEEGRVFLEEARKLVAQAGRAMEAARNAGTGDSRILRVGIPSRLGGAVSNAVAEYRKRFPEVNVQCRDICSSLQNDALHKEEIDVGFLRPPVDRAHLDCELLFEEDVFVLLPHSHFLAKRSSVNLREIAGEAAIIFDRSFSIWLYDKILGLYGRQGLKSQLTVINVAEEETATAMVAAGKAILMRVGRAGPHAKSGAQLVPVRLDEPEVRIELYMAWRKNEQAHAVFSFLDSTRDVFQPATSRASA
jgi:DNA-binding transcriptional LysR family regulator